MPVIDWGVFRIHVEDCVEAMRGMADGSVDSIVTDPPYALEFMGKAWDYDVPGVDVWREALRVLKPGGHLLSFGGSRTYHRMACAVEDAGFEIRDQIMWVYGSGFPKSHNGPWGGTALKPAHEPIVVARKPLVGTVAANVLAHGTGALNIDGCRIDGPKPATTRGAGGRNGRYGPLEAQGRIEDDGRGRWPANLIHDGSDEVLAAFPAAPGQQGVARTDGEAQGNAVFGALKHVTSQPAPRGDTGSAARFFYCAKASRADRGADNNHPTVKPTELMRYLCRLVTPPGGVVLDPFAGSGSTGKAAVREGFAFIGCEIDPAYADIAVRRIATALFGAAA